MANVKWIMIDDNNQVEFNNSELDSINVTVKDGEQAVRDAFFESMAEGKSIIVDLGGGNDARKGLEIVKNSGLEFTYIIPVSNSLLQAKNALDTYNLIGGDNVIFALNMVEDIKYIEKDWVFWFGDQALGIESIYENLGKPQVVYVPRSIIFELSALEGMVIEDLARFSQSIPKEKKGKIFFEQSGGNKEKFDKLDITWTRSKMADNYLQDFKSQISHIAPSQNICIASTKGGVGKSTISWHLGHLFL